MTNDSIVIIGDALGNIAAAFAERRRQAQPSHGAATAFPFVQESLDRQTKRLRSVGQAALADALAALGEEMNDA